MILIWKGFSFDGTFICTSSCRLLNIEICERRRSSSAFLFSEVLYANARCAGNGVTHALRFSSKTPGVSYSKSVALSGPNIVPGHCGARMQGALLCRDASMQKRRYVSMCFQLNSCRVKRAPGLSCVFAFSLDERSISIR